MHPSPGPPMRLELSGGGLLTRREFGAPGGEPLFFFHGWPAEAQQGWMVHEAALRRGWRVIAPNRPGLGGSTRQPGRGLNDWPSLVAQLADSLGIDRFRLLALSGGGPYALACAHALGPERIAAAAIVCGAPPAATRAQRQRFNPAYRAMLTANDRFPRLMFGALAAAVAVARIPLPFWLIRPALRALGPADRDVLSDPERFRLYYPAFLGAMRSGAGAIRDDGAAYGRPWPFDVREIRIPVQFRHGSDDRNFRWEPVRDLAAAIPNAEFRLSDDGHYSLLARRCDEALDRLAAC